MAIEQKDQMTPARRAGTYTGRKTVLTGLRRHFFTPPSPSQRRCCLLRFALLEPLLRLFS